MIRRTPGERQAYINGLKTALDVIAIHDREFSIRILEGSIEAAQRTPDMESPQKEAPKRLPVCTCEYWDKQCQVHGDPFRTEITGGVEICECLCHVPIGSGQAYDTTSCIHCMVIG